MRSAANVWPNNLKVCHYFNVTAHLRIAADMTHWFFEVAATRRSFSINA